MTTIGQIESEEILKEIPGFERQALAVSSRIHEWVLEGDETRRDLVDTLHGTQLGHPLHPVLTDVTIGAWVFTSLLDLLSLTTRARGVQNSADLLLTVGNLSAVATAMAGLADFSTIPKKAAATGAAHGLLNAAGLILNILSMGKRRRGQRGKGILLTLITQAVLFVSGWLGGEMVFKYKASVNHAPSPEGPEDWTPVLDNDDLTDGSVKRVEASGIPVLLYRYQGRILAMGAVCAHEGAPLEKGSFDGYCVTCPWHQSVYDLRDGSVVHGPSTYASPSFDVRIAQGMIELRVKPNPVTEAAIGRVRQLSK